MAKAGAHVYCTLLMSDSYLPGAVVLAHSLKDCGTSKKLAVLVTLDTLLPSTVDELKTVYDYVIPVQRIATPITGNLHLLGRYELRFAFTKIELWRQTQFEKIVYVDADVVALRAPDELFDLDAPFAAAPDIGWPDCFNSGLMLLKPNMSDFSGLQALASAGTSFDGADQGLLNEYFGDKPWQRLSFTYNCTPSATYQYEPAYRRYGRNISMVHFIGKDKPWMQGRQAIQRGYNDVYKELLSRWWTVYDRYYVTPASSAYGQIDPRVKTVKQYVRGEATQSVFGWAATGVPIQGQDTATTSYSAPGFAAPSFSAPVYEPPPYQPPPRPGQSPSQPGAETEAQPEGPHDRNISGPGQFQERVSVIAPHEAHHTSTERPMTEPGEQSENFDQGVMQPIPTVQQRKFSAPHMEWDATRYEPPAQSRPEAQNFPTERYEMSDDPGLFHAPVQYPEPPTDMWYKVPEIKPTYDEPPKPIFPWEQTPRPPPTRIFLDEPPPSEPEPVPEPQPEILPQVPGAWVEPEQEPTPVPQPAPKIPAPGMTDPSLYSPSESLASSVSTAPPFVPAPNWEAFSRANAWDEDNSIDRYVRALKISQSRKGNLQVLLPQDDPQATGQSQKLGLGSPPAAHRRESLILTDFPTEDERPSLPVTPAPQRRSTFWGTEAEGESSEQLPPAEGVPDQAQWVCPNCGFQCTLPIGRVPSPTATATASASASAHTPAPVLEPESEHEPEPDYEHELEPETAPASAPAPPSLPAPAPVPAPARVPIPLQAPAVDPIPAPPVVPALGSSAPTQAPATASGFSARFNPSAYASVWDSFQVPRIRQGSGVGAATALTASPKSPSFSPSFLPRSSSSYVVTPRKPSLTSGNDFFKKNPIERLEELRRSSIVAASQQQVGSVTAGTLAQEPPKREALTTAVPIPESKSLEERAVPWRNLDEMFGGEQTQSQGSQSTDLELSRRDLEGSSKGEYTQTRDIQPGTWRNLEESFSGEHTQEHVAEGSSDLARGIDPDVENKTPSWQAGLRQALQTETQPGTWRNLEESFSGEHTQKNVAEASSDLARGIDPDSENRTQTWQAGARQGQWTTMSSSSFASSTAGAGSSRFQDEGLTIGGAITPDSPQPQRFQSSFTKRSSDELTEKLVRDMETRMQEAMETQQKRQMKRPRAPTGWSRGTQRITLEEQEEEEEEAVDNFDEEQEEVEERIVGETSRRFGGGQQAAREYSEYDIA